MSTCYEHIRKKKDTNKKETFNKLQKHFRTRTSGYENALDNNQTDKYHDAHGRPEKMVGNGLNEEGN